MIRKYLSADRLIYFYLGLIFFYVVLRSIFTPIMHDEVLNFQLYAETGSFQPFISHPDANNHLISTALNHVMYLIFGKDLLLFRLPETLSFLLMAFYLIKFKRFFKSKIVSYALILIVCSSIYLLSFFSMARGYGLSLVFLIALIFHFLKYFENSSYRDLIAIVLYCSLMIWSNLALLFVAITVLGAVLVKLFFAKHELRLADKLISFGIILSLGIIPLYYAIKFSFFLREAGALYIGYPNNPFKVYFAILPADLFVSDNWGFLLSFIWALVTIISLVLYFVNFKQSRFLLLSTLILFGAVGGTILSNLLFEVNYPTGRAAVHIFILFAISFCFLLDQLKEKFKVLVFVPATYFLAHLIWTANITYSAVWKYESISEEFSYQIEGLQEKSEELLTISCPNFFARTLNYYAWKHDTKLNFFQDLGYPSEIADILITHQKTGSFNVSVYDTVYFESSMEVALLKRKEDVIWYEIYDTLLPDVNTADPFIIFDRPTFNVSSDKAYKAEFSGVLHTLKRPIASRVTFSTTGKSEECGSYVYGEISGSEPTEIVPFEFKKSLIVNDINCDSVSFEWCLWNKDETVWSIKKGRLRFFESAILRD